MLPPDRMCLILHSRGLTILYQPHRLADVFASPMARARS